MPSQETASSSAHHHADRFAPARRQSGSSIALPAPLTPQELEQLNHPLRQLLTGDGDGAAEDESSDRLDRAVGRVGSLVTAEEWGWSPTAQRRLLDVDDADDEGEETEDDTARRRSSTPPRLRRHGRRSPSPPLKTSRSSTLSSLDDDSNLDTPGTTPATSAPPSPAANRSKLPASSTTAAPTRAHSASDPTTASSSTPRRPGHHARKRASVHFVEPLPMHEADATDDAIRRLLISHDRYGWCSVVERALEWPLGLAAGPSANADSEDEDDDERRQDLDRQGLVNVLWRQGKKSQSVEAHVDFIRRTFSAPSLSGYLFPSSASTYLTPLTPFNPPEKPSTEPSSDAPPKAAAKPRRPPRVGSLVGLSEALDSGGELTRCRSDPMLCALGSSSIPRMTSMTPPEDDETESAVEGSGKEEDVAEGKPKLKSALKTSTGPKRPVPPKRVDTVEDAMTASGGDGSEAEADSLAGQAWSRIGGLMGGLMNYV